MTKFKYKFTMLTLIVLIAGIVAATVCAILNILRFFDLLKIDTASTRDYLSVIIAAVIGLIGIIIIIPIIFFSAYKIDPENLTIALGFIKTKIKLRTITRFTIFKNTHQLVLFYNQSDYIIININEDSADAFVNDIKKYNDRIIYEIDSEKTGKTN